MCYAQVGDRDELAKPVADTLFFAGEATHPAINPCLQAAIETGQRAAQEIVTTDKATAQPQSKL